MTALVLKGLLHYFLVHCQTPKKYRFKTLSSMTASIQRMDFRHLVRKYLSLSCLSELRNFSMTKLANLSFNSAFPSEFSFFEGWTLFHPLDW